jgi:hypothetical protein
LYELRDLIADAASPDAYFRDFEILLRNEPLAKAEFIRWEEKLQFLHEAAWMALKAEAAQYLTCRDPARGWHQLFDILGQAEAYKYLREIGCVEVRFVPRSDKQGIRTPDFEGIVGYRRVLCEVKIINISADEVRARCEHTVRSIKSRLDEGFFRKLGSDIAQAKKQLDSYDTAFQARHLVYICVRFDDWVGYYREDYLEQIGRYLEDNPTHGIEVVIRANY